MSKLITGLFRDKTSAELAIERLMAAGITREDISLLMSAETQGREFGIDEATKAPEGAATGAVAGGALGALAAGLVAIGVIAAPGIGLVAAGPLLAALAGAGAGGAAGGIIGALVGAGIPEHEAEVYADEIQGGVILLGVTAHDDRADAVKEVIENAGATSTRTR